ncbi:precorrin-2 dehydrogenase/sirohydrochlorin ferrochelatase family protein [Halobaculum sp. EA56]|uniref:precorrin-2 dehydrogenase/sirohydrochlorin ferrochelatase family protein n=1 Tax=Halobaculum sp. EA56 TaxID=3421648 RepID=UPI003EBE7CD2
MIPLLHDFEGETVLVVGGGPVGARKARTFAREARTVVVSPAFADRDFGDAALVRAAPAPEDLSDWVARLDPALVVAATDDEAVNGAAERAAREAGALVNRADRSGGRDAGSVVVPATVRDDPVVAAVATGGAAPALSKELRRRIESEIEGAGAMAELVAEIRADLRASDASPTDRREAVRAVVEASSVWKALQEGVSNARQEAERVMEEIDD